MALVELAEQNGAQQVLVGGVVRLAEQRPDGGEEGATHAIWIERDNERIDLTGRRYDVPLEPGDLDIHLSAGGGGCGDPKERDRKLVERDVAYGYISTETARSVYGAE